MELGAHLSCVSSTHGCYLHTKDELPTPTLTTRTASIYDFFNRQFSSHQRKKGLYIIKYFFDETKKVIEYWNKLPKELGSEEWMAWAKKLVITVEENPHLVVTKWWKEIEALDSKDHDDNHYSNDDEILF